MIVYRLQALLLGGLLGFATLLPGLVFAKSSAHCASLQPVVFLEVGATARLGGTVVLDHSVMMSAQMPGRVRQLAGKEGEHFKKDAVLVQINTDQLEAQWQAALAERSKAEVAFRDAQVQYNRELNAPRSRSLQGGMAMPSLFDQMFTQPVAESMGRPDDAAAERSSDLHSALVRIEQANMGMMQAQSTLRSIETKFRDSRSMAPFDGVIIKKFVEVGDTVQPGMPLLRFADIEALQIEVNAPLRLRSWLHIGRMAWTKLDTYAELIQVRVAQISPVADTERHTVKVKFDIQPGFNKVVAGMYAEVLIKDTTRSSKRLPVVPMQAVTRRGSLPSVYVRTAQGEVVMRLVRLGDEVKNHAQMRHGVVVLSGLAPDEQQVCLPSPNMGGAALGSRSW